ncbi:LacI family DNA-binding transcriptional regulator [Zunongwangia sp. F260]|uniref:LacI family DNA-binding transcriptional regulator n=1 Tax=Autumnicola lenta TaxID=3075593 RepID=A0ABU3CPP9_9FLAO|nr:LacI family DNA-binding transcriptional regulator [Zunongwangia sp. F260]MDT0648317.1 LacI family DNA-binding transcriptional regulator [Zunongwangia sp. F260]
MKKKQRVSIKDISTELGISITTISFIINKKAKNRISDEVIKKVEDYIKKVGYKPNTSAQTLRTGKTKTIVFMAEDISDPFFSAVAKEMEEIAYKNGYKMIYCSTENDKERASELISLFQDRQVDAFIITPPENFQQEIQELIAQKNEVVMLFDRRYTTTDHSYVILNNFNGAKTAAEKLIASGCLNVAYVGLASDFSCMSERLEGYKDAIKNHQSQPISLLLPFKDVKSKAGRTQFKNLLDQHKNIDGILFATNGLAINGLKGLKELNKKIPDELAVITFDDRDLFELHSPSISVLSQPVPALATELIKGTLQLLKGKNGPNETFQKILPGKLITRDSCNLGVYD